MTEESTEQFERNIWPDKWLGIYFALSIHVHGEKAVLDVRNKTTTYLKGVKIRFVWCACFLAHENTYACEINIVGAFFLVLVGSVCLGTSF